MIDKKHLWTTFIIIGFCIYFNSFNVPFYLDDLENIKNSSLKLENLTPESFKKVLSGATLHSRPVSNISFALNYYLGGYRVQGYHVVNTVIHILSAIFLYLLLRITLSLPVNYQKFNRYPLLAYWTALIWLVHPLATQSVVYLVQRMNSMSAMFYILAMLLYVKGRLEQQSSKKLFSYASFGYFLFCVVSGLMAVGSKEIAITLPFLIFIYEFYFFQDLRWRWLLTKIYWGAGGILIGFGAVWYYLGASPWATLTTVCSIRDFTIYERVCTQFKVVCLYISLILYPEPGRLALDRDFPISGSLFVPIDTFFAFLFIVTLFGLSLFIMKKHRLVSFCLLWFLLTLVIESSVVCLEMVFEHRTYLPSMFFIFMPVFFLFKTFQNKILRTLLLCVVVTLAGFWTVERNSIWSDPLAFYQDHVQRFPNKGRPRQYLAQELRAEGRDEEAQEHLIESLDQNVPLTYSNLGFFFEKMNRYEEAEKYYREAYILEKKNPLISMKLGSFLLFSGRITEAEEFYRSAVKIIPDNKKLRFGYGKALLKNNKPEKALMYLHEILKEEPDNISLLSDIGSAYAELGMVPESIEMFSKLLKLDGNKAVYHYNLGLQLVKTGDFKMAMTHYKRAYGLMSPEPPVYYNMANLSLKLGKPKEAKKYYLEYLEISPMVGKAYNNLGLIYAQEGDFQVAYTLFEKALTLTPGDDLAKKNMGLARQLLLEQKERTNTME